MKKSSSLSLALVLFVASSESAQSQQRITDPVFVRAQELVSDGNGTAGRAVIDSVLKANSPSSRIYPQALFWRASLAASAADAESDYKHLVVDYPLAPEAEDALLRLAQLELARGDRDGALAHLQRIPRDYPHSKSLSRASYWTARVLFEKNDIPGACTANASALSQITTDEIELQNQIQYQGQRCVAYNASKTATPVPAVIPATTPATTTSVPSGKSAASSTSSTVAAVPPAAATAQTEPDVQVADRPVAKPESTRTSVSEPDRRQPLPPPTAGPVKPTNAPANKPVSSGGATFSVQVAAYNKKAEAQKLTASLVKRGYDARVDGQDAPFRVRIGRYVTSQEAEAALSRIKARHMEGFVVRAPER
ncbi:MAG TPA: SPOR domain-containing protein [Gemmatimonadaceae bacterium]|nr:SPOR domain-containing protein [Gemmatimonadaceae bacterium]